MMLVPFLDRRVETEGRSPIFTAVGVAALVYMVALTAWGYSSWVPIWVVFGTGVLTAILVWATRPSESGQ